MKFPVLSRVIRELDRKEWFASDCVIRHPVRDFRALRKKLENSAYVHAFSST